jgi:UDP-2-acetamido-2,6-beta-L-arabino-hexul-4-ose reductase
MKTVLVTGSEGFIGKNLVVALNRKDDVEVIEFDIESPSHHLEEGLAKAEVIFHLAGVNRPDGIEEFTKGNFDLTKQICSSLRQLNRTPNFVLSSSTQAAFDNPYGISKRRAEAAVFNFSRETNTSVFVFRLCGVFGKWCRPNYNSVVATFCHNIANDLPITISDPIKEIELVYIDDVVRTFIGIINGDLPRKDGYYWQVEPNYRTSLGALAETIQGFRDSRKTLELPDMNVSFYYVLYATYLSYLSSDSFAYPLTTKSDPRGELAELLKSSHIGQVFISRTRPGITRGHHYHDTKVEKFFILEGNAVVRFRHILGENVIEYPVAGKDFCVVDIPPGYTHSIENIGLNDLIILFWADEPFNPDKPDVFGMTV